MNEMGLSPIRTNKFSPSTVHSLEKKMEKEIKYTYDFEVFLRELKNELKDR